MNYCAYVFYEGFTHTHTHTHTHEFYSSTDKILYSMRENAENRRFFQLISINQTQKNIHHRFSILYD